MSRSSFQKLRKVRKKSLHPLVHTLHRRHKVSRKTLFYMKEYGPQTNVARTIIRESIKILLLASILSSIGGLTLEQIKPLFLSIAPLIILLPALNDMVGDYGAIVSSKCSNMIYEGSLRGRRWATKELRKLFLQILVLAVLTAIITALASLGIAWLAGAASPVWTAVKIFLIAVADSLLLVCLLFLVAVFGGLHFYRKGEDPNNFLIPIATSVADFGNMILLSLLVILFF